MKPIDGTFAANAQKWGVAGLWIDGGRVECDAIDGMKSSRPNCTGKQYKTNTYGNGKCGMSGVPSLGRFPANLIHDGSDEVLAGFPNSTSTGGRGIASQYPDYDGHTVGSHLTGVRAHMGGLGDTGSAARFFYCAKASRSERNAGLEGGQNIHSTVKPVALMRYLARLTKTPTGGVVIDPFMGSGTTGIGCKLEGRGFIGIERDPDYFEIAKRRIDAQQQPPLEGV
jgi:site-specific DNA-methyltransferase (adenine-specific)